MNIPPLCIIQARLKSRRLPGKVLLPLPDGTTLLDRALTTAQNVFFRENVVVAFPESDLAIAEWCARVNAQPFAFNGDENDVLGRFYYCAHRHRWHPDSVIVRYTPDDPWKEDWALHAVAFDGLRLPVEQGGEAFTLAMLTDAHCDIPPWGTDESLSVWSPWDIAHLREHITGALFPTPPPPPPKVVAPWSVDTQKDFDAVCRIIARPT